MWKEPNTSSTANARPPRLYRLEYRGPGNNDESLYALELKPEVCGKIEYRMRAYPHHELLTHKFEMGMMLWL